MVINTNTNKVLISGYTAIEYEVITGYLKANKIDFGTDGVTLFIETATPEKTAQAIKALF